MDSPDGRARLDQISNCDNVNRTPEDLYPSNPPAAMNSGRNCRLGQRVTHAKHRLTERDVDSPSARYVHAGLGVYGRMVESTVYGEYGADTPPNLGRSAHGRG